MRYAAGFLSAFILVLYPGLGLALFIAISLVGARRFNGNWRLWLTAFSSLFVLVLWQGISGTWNATLAGSATIGVLAGATLVGRSRGESLGMLSAMFVLTCAGALESYTSQVTWHDIREEGFSTRRILAGISGIEVLQGAAPRSLANRFWHIPLETDSVTISFEARLSQGRPGLSFFAFDRDFNYSTEFVSEMIDIGGDSFTRITTPAGGNPSVTKRIDTQTPLGGRTFMGSLDVRVPSHSDLGEVNTFVLRELGGTGFKNTNFAAQSESWQTITNTWTVPLEATSTILRMQYYASSRTVDVRSPRLFEMIDGEWIPMEPLEPHGIHLSLAVPNEDLLYWPSVTFTPAPTWQSYTYEFTDPRLRSLSELRAVLRIENGLTVEFRNWQLTTPSGNFLPPRANPVRQRLWYDHQNLAGHSITSSALAAMSMSHTPLMKMGIGGTALIASLFVQSRTAWVALLAGLTAIALIKVRKRLRRWLWIAILLAPAVTVYLLATVDLGTSHLLRMEDRNSVQRAEIWGFAWENLRAKPWLGSGTDSFQELWMHAHPEDRRPPPTHAHNFWLHFGSSYGIPGLLASLWLTTVLVCIAWRTSKWRGLALLLPVLLMNMFDASLLYAGVLFPLVLGLNSMQSKNANLQHDFTGLGFPLSKPQAQ